MIGTMKRLVITYRLVIASAALLTLLGVLAVWALLHLARPVVAPDPRSQANAWATAVLAGDYSTAEGMMGDASTHFGFADQTRLRLTQRHVIGGRMPMYHLLATQPAGSSTNVVVEFHDHDDPATNTCITIQVSARGVITPLTDYYPCAGGA